MSFVACAPFKGSAPHSERPGFAGCACSSPGSTANLRSRHNTRDRVQHPPQAANKADLIVRKDRSCNHRGRALRAAGERTPRARKPGAFGSTSTRTVAEEVIALGGRCQVPARQCRCLTEQMFVDVKKMGEPPHRRFRPRPVPLRKRIPPMRVRRRPAAGVHCAAGPRWPPRERPRRRRGDAHS
jgi:hypothetical protein